MNFSRKKVLFVACFLTYISIFVYSETIKDNYFFGFPFQFIKTNKEIFLINRYYFLNPIFTVQNALIRQIGLILNIGSYYYFILFLLKIYGKVRFKFSKHDSHQKL